MKVGTKSLLFGVHQFLWHPFTVILAWHHLFSKWPSFDEFIAIMVHDLGYWGSPNMDGPEGEDHPMRSWSIVHQYLGINSFEIFQLVVFHSRHLARAWTLETVDLPKPKTYKEALYQCPRFFLRKTKPGEDGLSPSKLCWADKYSMAYDPWWLYLPRAWASGELTEYRQMSSVNQWNIPLSASHRTWYKRAQANGIEIGLSMDATSVPYQN